MRCKYEDDAAKKAPEEEIEIVQPCLTSRAIYLVDEASELILEVFVLEAVHLACQQGQS